MTAPLAARRPWASRASGSLTLAHGKSAAPVAPRATEAAETILGFSFLTSFLAPVATPGEYGLLVGVSLSFCLGSCRSTVKF